MWYQSKTFVTGKEGKNESKDGPSFVKEECSSLTEELIGWTGESFIARNGTLLEGAKLKCPCRLCHSVNHFRSMLCSRHRPC